MKKVIAALLLLLVALFILVVSGVINFSGNPPELIRIPFATPENPRSYSSEYEFNKSTYILENEPPHAYLNKDELRYTLQATALWGDPQDPDHQQTLIPQLSGAYTLRFFLFMERSPEKRARILVEQKRDSEIVTSTLIRKGDPHYRYEIPLDLEKKDRLVFTARGKGLAAISQPVFTRVIDKDKRNLVFLICADTLRSDHVGAYNPARTCTPNIDLLAQDAMRFTQAYSTSSWTLPALVSVFTALTTFHHNVDYGNEVIRPETPALMETLSSRFICYGMTGGAFTSSRYGISRGFDLYQEKKNDGWIPNAAHLLFKKATRILEKETAPNLLFFLHTYQIHDPYLPEKGLAKLFYQGERPGFGFNIVRFINGRKELAKKVPEKKKRQIEQIYDAGIFTFDTRFGEFLQYLKDKDLYADATIILFADHGEEFMDHGCWVHTHTLYNELVNVPLILKLPGNEHSGTVVDTPVSIMDILPTLLDLHGLTQEPGDIDGNSLLQALRTGNPDRILPMFLAPELMNIPGKVAIVKGWDKIIFSETLTEKNLEFFTHPPEFDKYEMYDLQKDPGEQNNLFEVDLEKSREMLNLLRNYKLKRGKPGYLPELEEQLKALGYIR
jgi:hypothetical protein